MKSPSGFPSLRGSRTLRFVTAYIPLPRAEGLQQHPWCLCPVEPGWGAGGGGPRLGLPQEPPGPPGGSEHRRVRESPSGHSATFSELCPDLCWARWLRWPQGLSSGATQSSSPQNIMRARYAPPSQPWRRKVLTETVALARLLRGPCSGNPLSFISSFIGSETTAALITSASLWK